MTPEFLFDPETHTYTLNGRVLPHVTEIVNGVVPRSWYADEWYLNRGRQTHKAIALLLRDNLDRDSLDPEIRGYVAAAERACREQNWKQLLVEQPLAHDRLLYAGTLDLLTTDGTLADWKATNEPQTEIQVGGYLELCQRNGIKVARCTAVELHQDGTYKLEHYTPWRSRQLFLAFLSVYGWKQKHIKPQQEKETK